MITNGFYYPNKIWKNKLHTIESTGAPAGSALLSFIVGNRRGGKSVGVGIFTLGDFFCYGYKSVLLRRYIKDFEDSKAPAMENFWNKSFQFISEFPDIVSKDEELKKLYPKPVLDSVDWNPDSHALTFQGHTAYIDGIPFCYPVAINLFNKTKNTNFDNVHNIIYDEFITEDGSRIPGEVNAVYNLYDTIARGRPDALQSTSIIFISNAITYNNDFFTELKLDREIRQDTKYILREDRAAQVEIVSNEIVSNSIQQSAFGKALKFGQIGKLYLGYAQGNTVKDDKSFIMKNAGAKKYLCNITYMGKIYAFYALDSGGFYMTDGEIQENFPVSYALRKEDHTGKTILLTGNLRTIVRKYKEAYNAGLLCFNSLRSKRAFMELYSLM